VSEQLALFSEDAAAPRGLRYQPSFITAQSEHEIIAQIRALPLAPFQFGAFEGKRRVASFGWCFHPASAIHGIWKRNRDRLAPR
jgi:hypothetical protein